MLCSAWKMNEGDQASPLGSELERENLGLKNTEDAPNSVPIT